MGNHFREPDTIVQFTRRSFLKSAPAIATPLALVATKANAVEIDQEKHLDQMLAIAKRTGLSMDNLADWFADVDLTQIAENVSNWREYKSITTDNCRPMERVNYHATQIRKAMKEKRGGEWYSVINEDSGFVLICC